MSVIDTLVTDRTEADASRYSELRDKGWAAMTTAERAEWVAGMKGAYNASDLNRVASAMSYLSQRFASAGYSVPVSYTHLDVYKRQEHGGDEVDRQDNYDFLEGFCQWLEGRNERRDLPQLPSPYLPVSLEVSNVMLMDIEAVSYTHLGDSPS